MSEIYHKFMKDAAKKAFDKDHRKKIQFNMSRYDAAVANGKLQYDNLELAKQRAAHLKNKVIIDLPKYLLDFESNFQSRGGKVIWAVDADEAVKEIIKILKKHNATHVVKSKTMVTEEIELNEHLSKQGIESLETDLGEYIVQLAGEHPYHIVTPAMHMSKEDVAALFHDKFDLDPNSSPQEITAFVRQKLRDKFYNAEVGITGANFLLADTGSVCLTENEGNGMMSISFPKVHIVVAGIEKLIPRMADLDLFWPLLATHGTGQKITVYNSIISGPRQEDETDGPEEMYVVLLDNYRTEILGKKNQRRALGCIRCGACLNACPIYRNIGGHAYGTTYSGPIGAVITPWLKGMKDYKHLSFASSLCGSCTEVCPVKINLHELLLYNRSDSVKDGYTRRIDRIIFKGYKTAMLHRNLLDMTSGKTKNKLMKRFLAKAWGERRALPEMAEKSFKQLWEERREGKIEKK
ncbi:MAG: iron-sulfur cluster-binding protein [Bacteroidales bacterium]|nr:iron-sulfur cluster-binding protein [Bacteroidales bacterium]